MREHQDMLSIATRRLPAFAYDLPNMVSPFEEMWIIQMSL
jgi:hypothetical protein